MRRMSERSEPMPMIKPPPRSRAPRPSARACAGWPASRPMKIASPIRKWPMLSSTSSGMAATAPTRLVVDAVAGVDLQAERGGRAARRLPEPVQQRRARRRSPLAHRLAVGAGVQLDHLGADRRGRGDLRRVGLDEQRDADAGGLQAARRTGAMRLWPPTTSSPPSVVTSSRRSGTRQAACGRWRSAMATISSVTAISKLSGRPRRRSAPARRCRRRRCGGGPRAGGR